jgi:hypothetical protein
MSKKVAVAISAVVLLAALSGLAPEAALPIATTPKAEAAVSKSLSGGGGNGNVQGAGDRLGRLLSGWAVPVLTVLAGCLLVGALASRNIGTSVGIVVITLLGLIFLLSPQSVETFAKGIASTVF